MLMKKFNMRADCLIAHRRAAAADGIEGFLLLLLMLR
jgi:hypothetical protein